MPLLNTAVDPASAEYKANEAEMAEVIADLRRVTAEARLGGGAESRKRHERRGKMLVPRSLGEGGSFPAPHSFSDGRSVVQSAIPPTPF